MIGFGEDSGQPLYLHLEVSDRGEASGCRAPGGRRPMAGDTSNP